MERYEYFYQTKTNKTLFFSKTVFRPKSIYRSCVETPAIQFCRNKIVFPGKIFHVFYRKTACHICYIWYFAKKYIFVQNDSFASFLCNIFLGKLLKSFNARRRSIQLMSSCLKSRFGPKDTKSDQTRNSSENVLIFNLQKLLIRRTHAITKR